MKKEDLIEIVPALSDEDAEKILGLYDEKVLEKSKEYQATIDGLLEQKEKDELEERILEEAKLANPKSIELLNALLDRESITLGEGCINGLKEQIEALKEKYPFIFASDEEKPRFTKQTKPSEQIGDLSGLSYKDRLALYEQMPEVYERLVR